ncbi:1,4-dihydroxy-2-naphthoate octaprenyltransferase [Akkermansiaceae bacterium]|nr:1,4-dihydroxy-2-naphthoate octaprenyltransferase [Akkermansiaceae bacterium]
MKLTNYLNVAKAARPKTLPAAVIPVVLGCLLAYQLTEEFHISLALCTLLGAIFIQIATNFFNDAIDAQKGADTEKRLGPQRVTASGLMSKKTVYLYAISCLILASIFGGILAIERGWVILLIGIPSLYLSYGYTGGPFPLAYRGMGEIFVILFFGWIATVGTVFVQTGEFHLESLLLGTQLGLLSAILILVNNIRDRDEDRQSQKNTIVVKLGVSPALLILLFMTLGCYLAGLLWTHFGYSKAAYLPTISSILGLSIFLGVSKLVKYNETAYNKYLGLAALQLVSFAILWAYSLY